MGTKSKQTTKEMDVIEKAKAQVKVEMKGQNNWIVRYTRGFT